MEKNKLNKHTTVNKELVFQIEEKEKRIAELVITNKELLFQSGEKENRAAELMIANKELIFQNQEKEKRAAELIIANQELLLQTEQKEKRAKELTLLKADLKKSESNFSKLNSELEQRVKEQTESVVKALEEKNLLLENIGDAFFALDRNWKVTYWNRGQKRTWA